MDEIEHTGWQMKEVDGQLELLPKIKISGRLEKWYQQALNSGKWYYPKNWAVVFSAWKLMAWELKNTAEWWKLLPAITLFFAMSVFCLTPILIIASVFMLTVEPFWLSFLILPLIVLTWESSGLGELSGLRQIREMSIEGIKNRIEFIAYPFEPYILETDQEEIGYVDQENCTYISKICLTPEILQISTGERIAIIEKMIERKRTKLRNEPLEKEEMLNQIYTIGKMKEKIEQMRNKQGGKEKQLTLPAITPPKEVDVEQNNIQFSESIEKLGEENRLTKLIERARRENRLFEPERELDLEEGVKVVK